ncbi:hypothetical protein Snas_5204 [Stackebrandtia nassauensis DSM 44728]|uniref:Uncharacterized protein n=1 Tax=Stackebrandtia nassauensis (strain DSM 44728 / CIP 108903 / NRRL B-16338 / NBRC 102104 / LLR-40K-21) TaxID=446470 RepID=D3QBV0_STANL|nr:hypothetical protein [Stackebrandtia nassauensis]ADD44839.1 hypothetical protein Snas_5204 [Stackebrandtia nassauensis DSM 44728]
MGSRQHVQGLQLGQVLAQFVQQPGAAAHQRRNHVQVQLVEQPCPDELPHRVGATGDVDVPVSRDGSGLLQGTVDTVGDEGVRGAALLLDPVPAAVGQHEHRAPERWVLAPRHLAGVEHGPSHHHRAGGVEPVAHQRRVQVVLAAGQMLPFPPARQAVDRAEQLLGAVPDGIVGGAHVRPGDVTIQRDRQVGGNDRHGVLLSFDGACGQARFAGDVETAGRSSTFS